MAADASDQLIRQIVNLLKQDATIHSFVADRIFNYVPRKSAYPYIVIHITDSDEWDTTTDDGEEHSIYVHVWDNKEGSQRANRVMRRTKELLHDVNTFPLIDHNLVNLHRLNKTMVREGQLYHGQQIFRAITEET